MNYREQEAAMRKRIRKTILWSCVGCLVLILLLTTLTTVPTGYTGILTTFGKVEDVTIEAGLHIKAPWQGMARMDNREQKALFNTAAFSSDIQQVDIQGSVNYQINKATAMNLYKSVGRDYYNTLIYPRMLEAVKTVFSRNTASGLVSSRETLSGQVQAILKESITEYGIDIVKVSIEDIDFTDAYTNAIEAKQVSEQELLKAETDQSKLTIEKEAEARRTVIEADAQATARRAAADAAAYEMEVTATAEAEANKKVAQSVTPTLIEYVKWTGWNGQWPTTMVGGDALPVLNIGEKQPTK